jgi:hypothetical protein
MCGRIAQSETRRYYARLLRPDILEREWAAGDAIPNTTLAPVVLNFPLFVTGGGPFRS